MMFMNDNIVSICMVMMFIILEYISLVSMFLFICLWIMMM